MMRDGISGVRGRARTGFGVRGRARTGFSLIEIMVAMTMLGIVLLSLARLSVVVSQRGLVNDLVSKRTAVMQREANKFGSIPYDSLTSFTTASRTETAGDFTYTRRVSRTATGNNRMTLKIVIVPARDTTAKDSVTIDRIRTGSSPLCSGC